MQVHLPRHQSISIFIYVYLFLSYRWSLLPLSLLLLPEKSLFIAKTLLCLLCQRTTVDCNDYLRGWYHPQNYWRSESPNKR